MGQTELRKRRRQKVMEAIEHVLSEFGEVDNRRLAYYASQRVRCSVDKGYATRLVAQMGYRTQLIDKTVGGRHIQVKVISTR